jgi:hypothetical protein
VAVSSRASAQHSYVQSIGPRAPACVP